ncbi:hypothetical protein [Microbacterium gilvum]|uniref:Glycosyltransferase RgtA/B/C/D-like domain-containing protein n=1 Tax=Microbacterium gilvum TaxID=1336204 RepID=A0ABP8ZXS5_9MICO
MADTARRGRRAVVADATFPAAASAPRGRLLVQIAAVLAAVAYLVLIPAGRAHLFRIWAEDGKEWLSDAALDAPFTHLLDPLGGYFHVIPRLVAQVVALLPVEWWAAGMAAGAAVVRALCALTVFHAARGHVPSAPARFAIAAALIVLPAGNDETIGNTANLHWFLFATLVWVLLARWETRTSAAIATAGAALLALSVPLAIVLTPLAIVRIVVLPRRRDRVPGIAVLAASAVVLTAQLAMTRPRSEVDVLALIASALVRGPLVTLLGPQASAWLIERTPIWCVVAATAAAVVLVVSLAAFALRRGRVSERVLVAGLLALACFCGTFSLSSNWQDFLAVDDELRTARYSTLPGLLLSAALVVSLVVLLRRRRVVGVVVAAVVGALVLTGAIWQLATPLESPDSPATLGITWEEGLDRAAEDCERIGDSRVKVVIMPHDAWTAIVPCALLE